MAWSQYIFHSKYWCDVVSNVSNITRHIEFYDSLLQSGKLCDLYQMLDDGHIDVGRRLAVWRGLFTLTLLYVDKHIDTSPITTKLANYFATVAL